jgi:methylthioribose-1-phosphate isomerase
VAAAYGLVLAAQESVGDGPARARIRLVAAAERLRSARPTAVNLAWAVDRCLAAVGAEHDPEGVAVRLLTEARRVHAEDEAACLAMGRHALALLRPGGSYLTHCNTGRLATAGIGTAFGAFVTAAARGYRPVVYACEVRPLLQGSRLTAFELRERGIEGRLLPDSAAGSLLRSGGVEAVFVGADRVARNGDTANKVGTYPLAELARANGVPFFVVAPTSTVDLSLADGSLVPIEQRGAEEVLGFAGTQVAPAGFPVLNPAFDVTPGHLVSAVVTERGVVRAPSEQSLPALVR